MTPPPATPPAEPMPPQPDDSLPQDPHLLTALAHAPDQDAEPPTPLDAAILHAAREALQRRARRRARVRVTTWRIVRARLMAIWRDLGRPRGMATATGLMLATLVGVMWWGQPVPSGDPVSPPGAPDLQARAPVPESAPPMAPSPAPHAADAVPSAEIASAPAGAPARARDQALSERRVESARASAAPSAPAQGATDAAQTLWDAVRTQQGHWRWARPGQAARPLGVAGSDWLSDLVRLGEGRWAGANVPPRPADWLWLSDGVPLAELWLQSDHVVLRSRVLNDMPAAVRLALPPGEVQALSDTAQVAWEAAAPAR